MIDYTRHASKNFTPRYLESVDLRDEKDIIMDNIQGEVQISKAKVMGVIR